MSKNAVFVLPFFIVGLVTIMPVISPDLARGGILSADKPDALQATRAELLAQNHPVLKNSSSEEESPVIIKTLITAYSSSVDETDDTPFITASGSFTREGVAASNFLPIGTRIRIPSVFGPKVFTIEDRMNSVYNDRVDIWFSTKEGALEFGKQVAHIEVI